MCSQREVTLWLRVLAWAVALAGIASCNSVLDLDQYSIIDAPSGAVAQRCTRDDECRASRADQICIEERGSCTSLQSHDCRPIAGPTGDPRAILIGALFATSDAQAATNLARQQSAQLAIEEINFAGGVPSPTGSRPLVLVACDSAADLDRAAKHLIDELAVPAIIGPNTSQDTLDLATGRAIERGTLLISPTAVASSIADLLDDDLSWLMVPNDAQRAPLIIQQIGELERELQLARDRSALKLSIVFRDDALGVGTRTSLNALEWGGKPLADPENLSERVRIEPYVPSADKSTIVDAQLEFAPDVLVLIGTAEAVTDLMAPLEASWPAGADRPYYVLIDSSRVPELIELAQQDDALRQRVRGVGVTPTEDSRPIHAAFERSFAARFGQQASVSGMGPAYDSAYALAYALAVTGSEAPSGARLAGGLRKLAAPGPFFETGQPHLRAAFQQLVAAGEIDARGTFAPLDWDEHGAVRGGSIEVWCIGPAQPEVDAPPSFVSSGLTRDLATAELRGKFTGCELPPVSAPGGVPNDPPPNAGSPATNGPPPSAADAGSGMPSADGGEPPPPDVATSPPVPPLPPVAPVDSGVRAFYRFDDGDPFDDVVSPHVMATNDHVQDGLPLREIRLRYYFSNEHSELCPDECVVDLHWAGVHPSGDTVDARSRYVGLTDGRAYLEISFSPFAPTLAPGESVEIQQQFHTEPYRNFDESDDYSFDATALEYRESQRIAVFRDDVLIWGVPPPLLP